MNGKVLKSNGIYQDIAKIRDGDYLINSVGKPIRVISCNKIRNYKRCQDLMSITHSNWYHPLVTNIKTDIYTWNCETNKPEWKNVTTLEDCKKVYSAMPLNIEWDMPKTFNHSFGKYHLEPSYKLGYLLAVFVRLGSVNKYKGAHFICSLDQKFLVDKLMEYGSDIFGYSPLHVTLSTSDIQYNYVSYPDEDISDLFEDFIAKSYNRLPLLFHCKDRDFASGISDGLIQSGLLGLTKGLSPYHLQYMYELMSWATIIKGKSLHYGNVIREYNGKQYICGKIKVGKYTPRNMTNSWRLNMDIDGNKCNLLINNLIVRI
jgi:hypothetical protein